MTLARSLGITLAIGVLCAAAVATFKAVLRLLETAIHGWVAPSWGEVGVHPILVAPVIGGLVVGLLRQFTRMSPTQQSSITQAIHGYQQDADQVKPRETPLDATAAVISVASGAALGSTDPAVGVGSTIGKVLGMRAARDGSAPSLWIAVGAAAGLSAALHIPIAATLFAVEVLKVRTTSRLLLVAIAATTSFALVRMVDDVVDPEPRVPAYPLFTFRDILLGIAIGIIAGLLSALAIKATYGLKHLYENSATPVWIRPMSGGVFLLGAGIISSGLLGIGYPTLEKVAAGTFTDISQLFGFAIGKTILMAISFASGLVGGFFAPSLFIGASLGSGIAHVAQDFWRTNAIPEAFSAVGMAAVLAGVVRAPLTAAVLLVEVSDSVRLLPGVLAGALVAAAVSRWIEKGSIYTYEMVRQADGQ
jgi:H+/Cl- antiporter ClcA